MLDVSARPLPMSVEEITPEWLTRALRTRAPGVTVRGVETVDHMAGTCTKLRLRLDLDEAGKAAGIPQLVILKAGFEPHSRELAHVHESEARGYRDVFPYVDLPTPACYFVDYVEEQRQGIVILEDLTVAGVEFCSVLRPQNFDQMVRRLSAFALFHAQTWESREFAPGGRWQDVPEAEPGLRAYMDQYLLKPDEWQRFVDAPRGAATSVHFHDLDRIIAAFDKITAFSRTLPHCMTHGDSHVGNLYVHPDGTPGFLDSMISRGPALKEIAYHMTGALDVADRRRWEQALIQHYLGELRRHGVDAPSFDEAMRQYRAFLLDGYIIFMVNESFYQPEAVNTAYTARFSAAMIDQGTLEVIDGLD